MQSEGEIWLSILAMAAVTTFCRIAFFLLPGHVQLPPRAQQALRHAPACALAAIIAPALLLGPTGDLNLSLSNHRLLAALVAGLVFHRTRKLWAPLVVGLAVFNALRLWA